MRKFLTYIQALLDFILPHDDEVAFLQGLTPDALSLLCKPAHNQADSYITALHSYKDARIKKLVWHMKFKEQRWVAATFGFLLARRISVEKFSGKTLLIPVPIHTKRRRERGYNQCEWLCEEITRNLDQQTNITYYPNIVVRDVYTVKQSWSSKTDRQKNIRNVFRLVDNATITSSHIIIIDDVCTTGATLDEMHRTLVAAGALSVRAFVIAR
jgi:ComF family protein